MPFGRKTGAAGRVTNFDSVYQKLIAPAVEQAGLEPIRADEEKIGREHVGRPDHTSETVGSEHGTSAPPAANARGARSLSQGRDRKVVADYQGGWHQRRMNFACKPSGAAFARGREHGSRSCTRLQASDGWLGSPRKQRMRGLHDRRF